ncbi:MAG: 16S rRNA (adenine(1518)-N(6)/adenine(1519)-N(6))-dimethyltransferase RsmA [Thermodesulfobacteriota bacterium]
MSNSLSTAALMRAFAVSPKKHRGQNFLRDAQTARMLVSRAGIGPGDAVLEIGAGMGAMTFPLAEAAHCVFAVEADLRVADVLESQITPALAEKIRVIRNDIMKTDLAPVRELAGSPLTVFGNLPYYLSSQVLIKLIMERRHVARAFLLFQKELADRILAPPGGRDYGRISVAAQYASKIRPVVTLSPEHFLPKPKIHSTLLAFDFSTQPVAPARDEALFFSVVAGAFSQRRKMLKNALEPLLRELAAVEPDRAFARAGIDPAIRAEKLSPADFVRLADAIAFPAAEEPGQPA